MNATDKTDRIVFWVFIGIVLFLLGVLIGIRLENNSGSLTVQSDYHTFYDDEGKMIVAPEEYHFVVDQDGSMVLTK